ncbi:MAG TPA: nucleoside-diphosphate sugar epimerase/dehydratase, partial [Ignavibacteriaceae bacterium]|nr:nucleoside-diphosphate sugar epimerase/dehydratase [Ignavibacteriaceae bacterium]
MKINLTEVLTGLNIRRKFIFVFFDTVTFAAALFLSFYIRFEFEVNYLDFNSFLLMLLIFMVVKFVVFSIYNLYDISWRYVSLQDLASIAKASVISNSVLFIIIFGIDLTLFSGFPRTVLLIDLMLTFILASGFRISKRMFLEVFHNGIGATGLKRTFIVGAGNSGEQVLRELYRGRPRSFVPVGFIDDDINKQNMQLQGIKVIGSTDELNYLIQQNRIDSIIIAIPSADRNFYKKIYKIAKDSGITDVKVVSTINDISNVIKVSVMDIRDINVSDLIGRQAISINTKEISAYLREKKILITGAAGSIGSEIARQVLFYQPNEIAILDINESDLVALEMNLKRSLQAKKINVKMYLCDISVQAKIDSIIENIKPDIIFHAAAYKHVPVLETHPEEGVRVNINGTYFLAKAAKKYGVKNFVLISTDKAVNPTSIMGATKRIAEYIVTGLGKGSEVNYVAVRFGNVLGSRGSALPIFIDQLKSGGPITITHPDMKRYFMTIPESVALVLQAASTGNNGDVFVLDMGD